MLYFAYGSNMDWTQMKARCPSAIFVGVAKLPCHRLAFTRKSVNRGCGVADAVHDAGSSIWGVVYEISALDIGSLDKSEGYRPGREMNAYWRRECMTFLDGVKERQIAAETYFAEPQSDAPPPNQDYMGLILSGARHWHLPAAYVAELEAIEVI